MTNGFEARIPWADLGLAGPSAPFKLMAAIIKPDGFIGNQFLPPLGPGQGSLGFAPRSLKTIPGTQYLTLPATTGVTPRPAPPALALASAPIHSAAAPRSPARSRAPRRSRRRYST